jgi:hypothetical protein
VIALVFALAGYRMTRARQMAQQYGFLRSPEAGRPASVPTRAPGG